MVGCFSQTCFTDPGLSIPDPGLAIPELVVGRLSSLSVGCIYIVIEQEASYFYVHLNKKQIMHIRFVLEHPDRCQAETD